MDNATASDDLTVMDSEFMGEDKTKDGRTKNPEVVDPFNCLIPGINLLFGVAWSVTKRGREKRSH